MIYLLAWPGALAIGLSLVLLGGFILHISAPFNNLEKYMSVFSCTDKNFRRKSAKLLSARLLVALTFILSSTSGYAEGEPVSGDGLHQQNKGQGKVTVTDADFSDPQIWGAAENVVKVKHLYFSAQPDAAGINAAKDAGVEVVINLRSPEELDWDEAGAVAQAGLTYYQVPISDEGPAFDEKSMQRISALVKKHHSQPLWLHCSSGNRASAWLAVHLVQDHRMDIDESIELARKAGLTNAELEARVRTYVLPASGN